MILIAAHLIAKFADPVLWIVVLACFLAVRINTGIVVAAVAAALVQFLAFAVLFEGPMPRTAPIAIATAAVAGAIMWCAMSGVRYIYRRNLARDADLQ
jgi:hypothetical protein